jgi:hypothetical protein
LGFVVVTYGIVFIKASIVKWIGNGSNIRVDKNIMIKSGRWQLFDVVLLMWRFVIFQRWKSGFEYGNIAISKTTEQE